MVLLILLIFGVFLVAGELAEAAISLLLIFAAFWLLSLVIGMVLVLFYLAAILAGIALAIAGLILVNRFIFKINRQRFVTLYLLSLPVSAMVIALALAGLTGSGFHAQEATHTQVSYWYFWTRDVVSYHEIPTVWKRIVQASLWISLGTLIAFAIEYAITPKTKPATNTTAALGPRRKRKRFTTRRA